MIDYTSQYQKRIEDFSNLYQLELSPNNRWIQLGALLPWDELVKTYMRNVSLNLGAKTIDPRVVIGVLIIKHKLRLSDEEVLLSISENPYMQFFLGLIDFHPEPLFCSSLLVEIRKRFTKETFDSFNNHLIRATGLCESVENGKDKEGDNSEEISNRGKLKLDATVSDQYIRYPNDLGLLNEAREKSEKIIDTLYSMNISFGDQKPRTYRRLAHTRYLKMAKKKKKKANELRKEIRYQLNCVERNLGYIGKMLDTQGDNSPFPLPNKVQKQLWVIGVLYDQQREMYDNRSHRCDHRIVSISQPHVRPIVRGKQGRPVEFGSKLGLSLANGFLKNETLSWDAYNEADDLIKQAEEYKRLYGYYPELIQVDKIYGTNKNRTWCKSKGIRITVASKGKSTEKTASQKRKEAKEYAERNHVEGKIGNAKQALSLNQIKAKLKDTSEAWIGSTIFVLNISNFMKHFGLTF